MPRSVIHGLARLKCKGRIYSVTAAMKVLRQLHAVPPERRDIITPEGKHCIAVGPADCSSDGRTTDGVLFDATNYHTPNPPRRHADNKHQIWFAQSHEFDSRYIRRPVGDVDWMASVNYATVRPAPFPLLLMSVFIAPKYLDWGLAGFKM